MVPLDGSEKDDRAIAAAVALSSLSGDALHLVRVGEGHGPRDVAQEADWVTRATGRPVVAEVLPDGPPAEVLLRYAGESGARVIVMATRAAGAVDRALHASVADEVLRESPCPVMLVPPGTDYMRDKSAQFGRALVPLDGSPLAAAALDFMLALPHGPELEYALLEVIAPGADRPAAAARLETAAARLRAAGIATVEFDVSEARDAGDAIGAAVREALVDLIVMSSRGQGGLRRTLLGSVAEAVVRASEVPVLLLTPRSLGAAGAHPSP